MEICSYFSLHYIQCCLSHHLIFCVFCILKLIFENIILFNKSPDLRNITVALRTSSVLLSVKNLFYTGSKHPTTKFLYHF